MHEKIYEEMSSCKRSEDLFMSVPQSLGVSLGLKNITEILVILGLLSSILLPPIQIGGFTTYLTILFSLTILYLVIILWAYNSLLFHKSTLYPMLLTVMVILISIVSWIIGLSETHIGDIFESLKYALYIPFFLAIPFLRSPFFERKVVITLNLSILFFIFICVLQSVPQLGASNFITLLYLTGTSVHFESAVNGYRLTFTGADPNIGAAICYFFVFFSLSNYFLNRKNKLSLVLAVTLIFFAMQTQSRTSMIAFVISFLIYFFFLYRTTLLSKMFFFLLIGFLVVTMFLYLDLNYVIAGFFLTVAGDNESLNIRLENIFKAIEVFKASPIIGYGPAKSHMDTIIDSEYALIIQRYGLVGVLVFLSFIIFIFKTSFKSIDASYGSSLFMMSIFSIFFMLTNNMFSGYQLMSIIVILLIACIVHTKDLSHVK